MATIRMSLPGKFLTCLAMAFFTTVLHAQDVNGRWHLRVLDMHNKVKVDATIRFTPHTEAESCVAGTWKRVIVEAKSLSDEQFFPLNEALAYEVARGELSLGRTRVCDGYLFLTGKLKSKKIDGVYNGVGPGFVEKLGTFSLQKIVAPAKNR